MWVWGQPISRSPPILAVFLVIGHVFCLSSNGYLGWTFYNLIVILMWSWEEFSTAVSYSSILTGNLNIFVLFSKYFISLFLERGEMRDRNIDVREKHQTVSSLTHPQPRTWPQSRHVHWPGIELGTFWLADWCSAHWAVPVRAVACSNYRST